MKFEVSGSFSGENSSHPLAGLPVKTYADRPAGVIGSPWPIWSHTWTFEDASRATRTYNLAIVSKLCLLSSVHGIVNEIVIPQDSASPAHGYESLPLTHHLAVRNAGVARSVIPTKATILTILFLRDGSQIAPAIIQRITVPMVTYFTLWNINENTLHPETISANGIVGLVSRTPICTPLPLVQPIKISSVNNRKLTPSKGNKTVGWFRRHNSLFTQVGHSQPSTAGLMCRHFTLRGRPHAL
jgi:hypothetical protein